MLSPFAADHRSVIQVILVLSLGFGAPTTLAQSIQARSPVPGADAQKQALALVREVYESEFAKARSDNEKLVLAETIINVAATIKVDTADAFVMLRVARDIGVGAGSISIANSAIDRMATRYAIDELDMKADAALRIAESAKATADRAALAEFAAELVDRLIAADRFKRAAEVAVAGGDVARRANDFALARKLSDHRKEAENLAVRY